MTEQQLSETLHSSCKDETSSDLYLHDGEALFGWFRQIRVEPSMTAMDRRTLRCRPWTSALRLVADTSLASTTGSFGWKRPFADQVPDGFPCREINQGERSFPTLNRPSVVTGGLVLSTLSRHADLLDATSAAQGEADKSPAKSVEPYKLP